MMFFALIIAFNLFSSKFLIAQIPTYEYSVYIEDSKGNLDSVKFVYHKSIDTRADRIRFRWKDITSIPFNNEFEIRTADLDWNGHHSKISPLGYLDWFCSDGFAKYSSINIRAENFPLRMYWDSSYFNMDTCLQWSRFSRFFAFTYSTTSPNL